MNKKIMQVRNVLHDRSAPNPLQNNVLRNTNVAFMLHLDVKGTTLLLMTPSISCGRFNLRCTKSREARRPPFPEGAFKMKQKTGHTPDSIASSCGENDVEAHPKAKVFKKKGLDHIDLLDVLFANSQATGSLACASTQGPPTSDEERDIQSAFFDVGINSNTGSFLVGDEIEGDDDPKVGWSCGNDGGRKGAHLDLALDAWIAMNLAKKEFYIR
ncbi:hypothetical protein TEA_029265 [Camellia sinensis var. sinensis]|uniref:Uncharacterized protein n=1 Tax=Camellia sinensis var. sinensis TaxID=542762 RepID=A0A4V3WLE5_CAMSN|nr:hypothetical protein TEA_029265 [Camellia sinensis var. sinensis]